jgi:hypothetical protein
VAAFDNEEASRLCETVQVNLLKVGLRCDDPEIRRVERSRNSFPTQGMRPNKNCLCGGLHNMTYIRFYSYT